MEYLSGMPDGQVPMQAPFPTHRPPTKEEQRAYFLSQIESDQFSAIDELVNARVESALSRMYQQNIVPLERETFSNLEFREIAKMQKSPEYKGMAEVEGEMVAYLEKNPDLRETLHPQQYLRFAYLEAKNAKNGDAVKRAAELGKNEAMKEMSASFFSVAQQPGRGPATGMAQSQMLTPQQKDVCRKMGVPEATYAQFLATNNYPGGSR